MLINMNKHKDAQKILLREITSMLDNETSGFQETNSLNYSNLNNQLRIFQNQEFVINKKLIFVTDECNRINSQYNDTRQINVLTDAAKKSKEFVERPKLEIEELKHDLSILSLTWPKT